MSAFEIEVGTIARLLACDNCELCEDDDDPCSTGRANHQIVKVIRQYKHEDSAMETPCFIVRVLSTGNDLGDIRMWDLEAPSPLEILALEAE